MISDTSQCDNISNTRQIDSVSDRSYSGFTVGLSGENVEVSTTSLQSAFEKFLRTTQKRKAQKQHLEDSRRVLLVIEPNFIVSLRNKFVEQVKAYIGTPYAKKYWSPEDPEYRSEIFLDCCGLIRRAQSDLKDLFGFILGPWNQAYMYDTLPLAIERDDMAAGDLVFTSGLYLDPAKKPQKHDMVHVEVWVGDGMKTVGARWQRGKVQQFDDYRFDAKSFHSPIYHFRSIDTWLQGVCRSFCPDHQWTRPMDRTEKKSIFSHTELLQREHENNSSQCGSSEKLSSVDYSSCNGYDDGPGDQNSELNLNEHDLMLDATNGLKSYEFRNDCCNFSSTKGEDSELKLDVLDLGDCMSCCTDVSCLGDCNNFSIKDVTTDESGIVKDFDQAQSPIKDLEDDTTDEDLVEDYKNFTTIGDNGSSMICELLPNHSPDDEECYITQELCIQHPRKGIIQFLKNLINSTVPNETHAAISNESSSATGSDSQGERSLLLNNKFKILENSIKDKIDHLEKAPIYPHVISYSDDVQNSGKNGSGFNSGGSHERDSQNYKSDDDQRDDPDESGDRRRRGGRRRGTKSIPPSLFTANQHQFFVGGGNGTALVTGPLERLGWKRTLDKHYENYRLKWVECKSKINYSSFKEGEQLVNHIPNCQLLTNKLGLLTSLRDYETLTLNVKGRTPPLKMADFFPETYNLNDHNDRDTFLKVMKENETWICKPAGMNQGKGIYLIRSREEIVKILEERDLKQQTIQARRPFVNPVMPRIIQRYITNPLLLEDRKFDLRAYMLIASTVPYVVVYHKGYVRLSCNKYDGADDNLTTHLTNQYIQKKDPTYQDVKEDTAWSMEKLNDYVNATIAEEKGLETDWVYKSLTKQMQKIMTHCFNCVKNKLQSKVGYFDLYGLDFMVDTDMKVWLIEINVNPALHVNCEALKDVIPGVVEETLHLAIECFEKSRRHQPLFPLKSLSNFTLLSAQPTSPSLGGAPATRSTRTRFLSPSRLVLSGAPRQGLSPPRDREISPDRNRQVRAPVLHASPKREQTPLCGPTSHNIQHMTFTPPSASIQFKLTHAARRSRLQRPDRADCGN